MGKFLKTKKWLVDVATQGSHIGMSIVNYVISSKSFRDTGASLLTESPATIQVDSNDTTKIRR